MYYYEDLEEEETFDIGSETVTVEEIVSFAEQWDPQPFHLHEEAEIETLFDGLVASGLHILCLGSRMAIEAVFSETANMGGKGIDDIQFTRPVEPSDTLSGEVQVREKRSEPTAGRGDVVFRMTLTNQHDEQVVAATFHNVVRRRDADETAN
jgi:acyl dehydratase